MDLSFTTLYMHEKTLHHYFPTYTTRLHVRVSKESTKLVVLCISEKHCYAQLQNNHDKASFAQRIWICFRARVESFCSTSWNKALGKLGFTKRTFYFGPNTRLWIHKVRRAKHVETMHLFVCGLPYDFWRSFKSLIHEEGIKHCSKGDITRDPCIICNLWW